MSRRGEGGSQGEERAAPSRAVATYLMTAGLASDDYRFLGRAPREAFWRKYSEYTSFERPTAIVTSKGEAFRMYLSGVLSARKDRTKTPLRYTLVLEGPSRSEAARSALRALSAFVCDLAELGPSPLTVEAFGRALDAAFPEPFVESALAAMRDGPPRAAAPREREDAGRGPVSERGPLSGQGGGSLSGQSGGPLSGREAPAGGDPLSEIEGRVARAIESLPKAGPFQASDARFFSGGRASLAARSQFLGFAQRLLEDGEAGAALVVNLAARDHLESLGAGEASCAVLFAGEAGDDANAEPLEQPPKKGLPGSPKGRPRAMQLARAEQAEPGWSIPRLSHLLLGALRTVRAWLRGTRASS